MKTLLFLDQVRFDSMWYVPMILSIYLVLPIFAVFLRQEKLRPALLAPMALLYWTAMVLPVFNEYRSAFGHRELTNYLYYSNFFSEYLLYVLAGWWVAEGGLKSSPTAAWQRRRCCAISSASECSSSAIPSRII